MASWVSCVIYRGIVYTKRAFSKYHGFWSFKTNHGFWFSFTRNTDLGLRRGQITSSQNLISEAIWRLACHSLNISNSVLQLRDLLALCPWRRAFNGSYTSSGAKSGAIYVAGMIMMPEFIFVISHWVLLTILQGIGLITAWTCKTSFRTSTTARPSSVTTKFPVHYRSVMWYLLILVPSHTFDDNRSNSKPSGVFYVLSLYSQGLGLAAEALGVWKWLRTWWISCWWFAMMVR